MSDKTACPKCNSSNARCFDEVYEVFTDDDDPDRYDTFPVGYYVCLDCGAQWAEGRKDWHGYTWAGVNERDAFGWDDD